jgi:hypothetical protein
MSNWFCQEKYCFSAGIEEEVSSCIMKDKKNFGFFLIGVLPSDNFY